MKGSVTTIVFLCIGIITAIYIGFGFTASEEPRAIDNEVQGLNEKYVLKFSHIVAENTPKGAAANYFAQLVREKTNGWVEVQVFPNGILYSAQEEFDALKANDVHVIAPAFSEITVHDPNWLVLDLPFLFHHEQQVRRALNSEIGELLNASILSHGYKNLGFWDNHFKQLTNNVRPIRRPQDVADLRVRIMPSDVLVDTYKTLGAKPYLLDFNEVYEALSANEIDATENTLSNIYSKGFFLQQKYMTISNHNYLGYGILMNADVWNSIPTDFQNKISEAVEESSIWLKQHATNHNEEALDQFERSDLLEIHYMTTEERNQWQRQLHPIYQKYAGIIDQEIMGKAYKLLEDKAPN